MLLTTSQSRPQISWSPFHFSKRSCQISAFSRNPKLCGIQEFSSPPPCHNPTSSGSHSDNGVPHSTMKAPQGSYFPADSPSSGVTVTGPPGHHVPTNLLLLRGRTSPLPTFPHMEMRAPGAAQGGLPVAALPGVASSILLGVTLGALLVKDQRHPC